MRLKPTAKLTFLLSVISIFSLISCKKQPTSDFMLKQYEYSAGDMIEYENFSTDFDSCCWQIVDEEDNILRTFGGAHPNIVTSIISPDGYFKLRLTTFSKKEKKKSVIEKGFLMKTYSKNILTVNSNGIGDHEDYDVFVDNQYVGQPYYNGSFQVAIPIGIHIVKLVAGYETKVETFNFNYPAYMVF